jgi:hypothetical protein
MIKKSQLVATLKDLPDSFSIDDLLDRIILLQKIEIGLEQSAKGKVHSTEKAKRKLKKWLK